MGSYCINDLHRRRKRGASGGGGGGGGAVKPETITNVPS